MPSRSCLLFFPGSRPELLAKAVATGAGIVCTDLEDAVGPDGKDDARGAVVELLARHRGPPGLSVRVNHPSTDAGRQDLEALAEVGRTSSAPLTLMVPKVAAPHDLEPVQEAFVRTDDGLAIIAVIETVAGLARVEDIATAKGVGALLFGGLDLSAELRCTGDWESLLYARSRCVHAARLGGVDVIDSPFIDLRDADGLRDEAERSRRLGFDGKAAIHPGQVGTIVESFAPDPAEVERARRVIEASERGGGGALLVDGVMVDEPVVEIARRIVERARSEEP
jgi:(S)-citramalyl-CoA lyase